jgi:hypothetical protein
MSDGPVCDVVLTREQLHYLARYVTGEPSSCSPFHGVPPPESLTQPALDDLVSRRLLGPAGVAPGLLRTLERLHGAAAFGGMALRGDALESEGLTFFGQGGTVALVNQGVGLRVISPLPGGEITALLGSVLGVGSRRDVALDVSLGVSESRVLAAALDLWRRESLRELLDGRAEPVCEAALAPWIQPTSHTAQWVTGHIAPLLARRGGTFEPRSVPPLVAQLEGRGLLQKAGEGLTASPAIEPLVRRLALLDRGVELRGGRVANGGPPLSVDIVMVRGDSGTVLLWEAQPDGSIRWVTPSPDEASRTALRLLTHADALTAAH